MESKGDTMEKLLAKLDNIRKSQGLSIYKLTMQADLSENTIYNWYSKKSQPTIEALQAVCQVLNVSLSSLFANNEMETLTAQEEIILNHLRALTPSQKELILRLTQELAKTNEC